MARKKVSETDQQAGQLVHKAPQESLEMILAAFQALDAANRQLQAIQAATLSALGIKDRQLLAIDVKKGTITTVPAPKAPQGGA